MKILTQASNRKRQRPAKLVADGNAKFGSRWTPDEGATVSICLDFFENKIDGDLDYMIRLDPAEARRWSKKLVELAIQAENIALANVGTKTGL